MPTGTDICTSALLRAGILGVGNPPAADQISRALVLLNDMLALWSAKRWLNYAEIDHTVVVTGAQSYTIGPSGMVNVTARPDRIEWGYVRLLNGGGAGNLPVDIPLDQLYSYEDNAKGVALKTLQTQPMAFFYDSAFPLGKIYPVPIPNDATRYELHFGTRTILPVLVTPATNIVLPPQYTYAMRWCLASECRAEWRLPVSKAIDDKAADGLKTIRSAAVQVPSLALPAGLGGSQGIYNPFGDTTTSVP
jgi:hypothetical protein